MPATPHPMPVFSVVWRSRSISGVTMRACGSNECDKGRTETAPRLWGGIERSGIPWSSEATCRGGRDAARDRFAVAFAVNRKPAPAERGDHCLGPVIDRQLAQDRCHMVLYGLGADAERIADFGVGHAVAHLAQDFKLTARQGHEGVAQGGIGGVVGP